MSAGEDLGPLAPVIVAVFVIGYLALMQPLSGELAGISMNWVGAAIVAVGGLMGAAS